MVGRRPSGGGSDSCGRRLAKRKSDKPIDLLDAVRNVRVHVAQVGPTFELDPDERRALAELLIAVAGLLGEPLPD
jgi:hypothetical protein